MIAIPYWGQKFASKSEYFARSNYLLNDSLVQGYADSAYKRRRAKIAQMALEHREYALTFYPINFALLL